MAKKLLGGAKALNNPWKGYKESRTWGKWFVIQWPDVHPDSHCEEGQYTPHDEKPMCMRCGWIPPEAICCGHCIELLRNKAELHFLASEVTCSSFSSLLLTGYQAYVDHHRKQLVGPPFFEEVKEWWNGLPSEKKDRYIKKYDKPDLSSLLRLLAQLID